MLASDALSEGIRILDQDNVVAIESQDITHTDAASEDRLRLLSAPASTPKLMGFHSRLIMRFCNYPRFRLLFSLS